MRPYHLSSLLLVLSLFALSGCEVEGDDPGECSDGVDNDQDSEVDCADAGCSVAVACAGDDDDTTEEEVATTMVVLVGYASGEQAKLQTSAELFHPDVAAEDIPEVLTGDLRGITYHLRSGSPELVFVGASSGTEITRAVVELKPDGLTVLLLDATSGTLQQIASTAEEKDTLLDEEQSSQILLWDPTDRFSLSFYNEQLSAYSEAYSFSSTPEWHERVAPDVSGEPWGCFCLNDSSVASECVALGLENYESTGTWGFRIMIAVEPTDLSWSQLAVGDYDYMIAFSHRSSMGYGWGSHVFDCTRESYQNDECSPEEWFRSFDGGATFTQTGCPVPTDW